MVVVVVEEVVFVIIRLRRPLTCIAIARCGPVIRRHVQPVLSTARFESYWVIGIINYKERSCDIQLVSCSNQNALELFSKYNHCNYPLFPLYSQRQDTDDRLRRLQGDKESLALQVQVLSEQVSAQSEKIVELERAVLDKQQMLNNADDLLRRVSLFANSVAVQIDKQKVHENCWIFYYNIIMMLPYFLSIAQILRKVAKQIQRNRLHSWHLIYSHIICVYLL